MGASLAAGWPAGRGQIGFGLTGPSAGACGLDAVRRRPGRPPRLATEGDVASLGDSDGWMTSLSPRSVTCSVSGRSDMVGPLVGSTDAGQPEMLLVAGAASG